MRNPYEYKRPYGWMFMSTIDKIWDKNRYYINLLFDAIVDPKCDYKTRRSFITDRLRHMWE